MVNSMQRTANSEQQTANGRKLLAVSRKLGFTLIELLVVITIIGLLASIGIASFTRAQARGRDGRRQADLSGLRNALELYYSEHSIYHPAPITPSCINPYWCNVWTLGWLRPTYINPLPSDPKTGWDTYRFTALDATGQGYCLEANLEGTAPPSTCTVGLQSGYDYGVGNP